MAHGRCMKCKENVEIKNAAEVVMKNGMRALKGECGKCGTKSFDFYPDSGTTLCKKCVVNHLSNSEPIKIANRTIKFYSHCTGWPLHALTRLRPSTEITSPLSALLEAHLNHLLKRRLLSSEFLSKACI